MTLGFFGLLFVAAVHVFKPAYPIGTIFIFVLLGLMAVGALLFLIARDQIRISGSERRRLLSELYGGWFGLTAIFFVYALVQTINTHALHFAFAGPDKQSMTAYIASFAFVLVLNSFLFRAWAMPAISFILGTTLISGCLLWAPLAERDVIGAIGLSLVYILVGLAAWVRRRTAA